MADQDQQYISLQEATKFCEYSQEYLSLRARHGKLKAEKRGRNWFTTKEWLAEYIYQAGEYKKEVQKDAASVRSQKNISPPDNLPIEGISAANLSLQEHEEDQSPPLPQIKERDERVSWILPFRLGKLSFPVASAIVLIILFIAANVSFRKDDFYVSLGNTTSSREESGKYFSVQEIEEEIAKGAAAIGNVYAQSMSKLADGIWYGVSVISGAVSQFNDGFEKRISGLGSSAFFGSAASILQEYGEWLNGILPPR